MKELNLIELHKMIFIYNAIQSGWSVGKKSDKKFEFTKNYCEETMELELENFVTRNLDLDAIFFSDRKTHS